MPLKFDMTLISYKFCLSFSPLHIHAGGSHDISVALIGVPQVLEKNDCLEVDLQSAASSDSVSCQDFAQRFGDGKRRCSFSRRRLDDCRPGSRSGECGWARD